ncbi:contactin-associated protein-like 2 isoform X2 [Apostichopus japonicus]|uniref:contactin-associated protein-like 2 isoform X2 n=1 Tax=Stichopus japonicus TaxID=307972 RepID=UPI003AB54759
MAGWILTVVTIIATFSLGASEDVTCSLPLGVESGAILDHQLSATTSQNVLREPRNARLHRNYGDGGWYPSEQNDKQNLTIDLIFTTNLTGIATQGATSGGYAQEYQLWYSMDGEKWEVYRENSRTKIFKGNTGTNQVTKHTLKEPIQVKMVRFNPTKFDDLGMRVEVYGCYDNLSLANFNGSSYIRYNAEGENSIQTEQEYITFRFRTDKPDGILFHAFGTSGDYLLFQLLNSKLVVTLNLGNSHVSDGDSWIEGGSLLDDNQWHLVAYKRNIQHLKLTVDGATVTNYTNGQYMKLDLTQRLYIGGTEFVGRKELMTSQPFVGCIQRLLMSNRLEEKSLEFALDFIAEVYRGVKTQISTAGEISNKCQGTSTTVSVTFPETESHLVWPRSDSQSNKFKVQFQFRTFERSTYMVYNRLDFAGLGMILVGLRDTSLVVIIHNRRDSPITVPAGYNLNDGLWHHVLVDISSTLIRVSLDGVQTNVDRVLSFTSSQYYHFGGTASLTLSETFDLPGFRGCMKDIYIGETKLNLHEALSESIPGVDAVNVEIDSCGLQDWCSPNPCEHGGECTPEWDSFRCTCTGHYTGATCHTSSVEQSCEEIGSSGTFFIDPDGSGPMGAVQVDCEIDDEDNIWTVMNHDAEDDEDVPSGSVEPGSYDRAITYRHVPMEHMMNIIDNAHYCEQTVHYTCNSAKLLNSPAGDPYGWWVDRHGSHIYSWGDAHVNSRKCACGMTRTCSDPNKFCNCDADVSNGLIDEGTISDKDLLPVTRLQFGDVDQGNSASFRLGKLRCRGDANLEDAVTFRTEEAHLSLPVQMTREGALDVSFQFKTTVSQSVLLSAEGHERTFFQVELHSPTEVVLRFDFGEEVVISHRSNEPLNDDKWRTIRMNLDKKEVTLQVDSDTKLSQALINGHREFKLESDIFVGTTPHQTEGFVGCIRKLQINGETFNLGHASLLAQEVVEGCSGHCSVDPCLFGGRCIEGYSRFSCNCSNTHAEGERCSKEVGAEMGSSSSVEYTLPVSLRQASDVDNITVGFTTSGSSGVLMRIENDDARYQQISIESGALSYKYKLTEGLEKSLRVSQHNFGDDRHHFVYVVRSTTEVTLKVDEYPIQRATIDSAVSFTPGRLIVGAAINGGQNFQGCISRVHFNSSSVNISPIKLYFDANKPSEMRGQGIITQSQCRVHNIPPPLLSKEPPVYSPTDPPPTETVPDAGSVLAPGDKATIAVVIILLLLAFIVLVFLITTYMHRHKGEQMPPPPKIRGLHY